MGNCRNCGDHKEEENEQIQEDIQQQMIEIQQQISSVEIQSIPLMVSSIQLEVKTWLKESYSLYDYENKTHVKEQILQVSEEGALYSKASEIIFRQGQFPRKEEQLNYYPSNFNIFIFKILQSNESVLLQIIKIQDAFYINNLRFQRCQATMEEKNDDNKFDVSTLRQQEDVSNLQDRGNSINESLGPDKYQKCYTNTNKQNTKIADRGSKIWLVVRSAQQNSKNEGFRLVEGDTIKLGRVKLLVKEIQLTAEENKIENELAEQSSSSCSVADSDSKIQCKVCLSCSVNAVNPFVSPCKCSGSLKYIHLQCLQKWIKSKVQSRCTDDCILLLWKNLECELCKFVYPPIFKSDGNIYDLVELSKPKSQPFVMLEFFQKKYQERDNREPYENSNGMYIILLGKQKTLRLGRAHDLEVNINDISVSRMHATLKLVDGKLYIQDKKSKFGTLVLLQKNIELVPEISGLEIQIGRSLIHLQVNNVTNNKNSYDKYLGREETIIVN